MSQREAFASGRFVGPRLFCCGDAIRTTTGHDPFWRHCP
jgi:hypothetical protein